MKKSITILRDPTSRFWDVLNAGLESVRGLYDVIVIDTRTPEEFERGHVQRRGRRGGERAVEAVTRAAAELAYRPNLSARSLVTGRHGLVGLVVNETNDTLFSDPYFARVARGDARERGERGGPALHHSRQARPQVGHGMRRYD